MRVLVAGSTGQLARALVDCAAAAGVELLTLGRPDFDIERRHGAERIGAFAPEVIINAAAYTAVDAAEGDSERAFAVNRDGAAWLAAIAAERRIQFLHVSTDYVFDGAKTTPYTESDRPNPQTVYGLSKFAGEEAVLEVFPEALIFRTAWVYSPYGQNFVKTMLRLAAERDSLRVVDDQSGNPTSAHDIATALLHIAKVRAQPKGTHRLYHLAAAGEATWFSFAEAIMHLAGERGQRTVPIAPIASIDYPTAAKRPANSRLDCERLHRDFGLRLPLWRTSLAKTLTKLFLERVPSKTGS